MEKALELIREAFRSVKLEIEDVDVNENYICTQYIIKSFKYLAGFRGMSVRKIENALPTYLYPHHYRLSITENAEICIELKSEKVLPPPSISPVLENDAFVNSIAKIPIPIGETIAGHLRIMDLAQAPHILIAGATMQGKSEFLHSTIVSLLHPKNQPCSLILIDPKGCEFVGRYFSSVLDIYVNPDDTLAKLKDLLDILHYRHSVNTKPNADFAPIVVIIDELADLIMAGGLESVSRKTAKEIEKSIIQLAQEGKAAGIHLIIATQRPIRNIITGLIKCNFPTRIAFRVCSKEDSKTIIDTGGAELLYGHGDMLYTDSTDLKRLQGFHITEKEFQEFLTNHNLLPKFGNE